MSTLKPRTKDIVELCRRWFLVVSTLVSVGGIGFIIWAGDARIKEVGYKSFVSKAAYDRDIAAAQELKKVEKENVVDRLQRIETDVREIRKWIVPAHVRAESTNATANNFGTRTAVFP
jgi:hypothetical protein